MSCVCIFIAPAVVAAWPSFSAAVVAAATTLGYTTVSDKIALDQKRKTTESTRQINLEINQSEIVTNQLGRDQSISVTRNGATVTFSRDMRGRASLCVEGEGFTKAELQAIGEELSKRVIQTYVYQRLRDEMQSRQFNVVEEERTEDNSIRLKVRRWDN